MYKDSTFKEKFAILKEWNPEIIELVKKDLKNEHLKQDYVFAKKYLPGKNIHKVTADDLIEAYGQAIEKEENGEKIAEFIANRWMLHSAEIYGYFETELAKINPDFDAIEKIEAPVATKLINDSVTQFGALNTYLFSVINSVAFDKADFDKLQKLSRSEKETNKANQEKAAEEKSFEDMVRDFEQRLARIEDKYEKKIDGLQKKYVKDTDMLKKQVATLQRKLSV